MCLPKQESHQIVPRSGKFARKISNNHSNVLNYMNEKLCAICALIIINSVGLCVFFIFFA
ncbi:hypothetical protein BSK71_09795 [Pectobacterium actinidiae]|uniref:Uncharacterized protein n=1 Tax=Pectobacterium actinidiae TaxID=1507808 RepID=A0A1V2R477_9GAMM|nr:hypothetical protein BSK69_04255 [Pectobacterium actinidiae]ONK06699.1 hypothetical protein BSK71_09795 [Pectobacterium actinidiae]